MQRAGLFANTGAPVQAAGAAGLEALGMQVLVQIPGAWSVSQAERGLAAVVVNGLRGPCAEAARHYGAEGVPVILVDLPHLRHVGPGGEPQLRISPPSHAWLPAFEGSPPLDRLERLGIELQSRKRVKGQSVLLVGQKSGDSAHGMDGGSFRRWATATRDTIRALTDSKILWRPHPRDRWVLDGVDGVSDPAEEPISAAFERSWLVVAYNSTAGLEALIAGLPVIAEGPAVYGDLAVRLNQFSRAEAPDRERLTDLLAAIAYTQWTLAEISSGLPFEVALGRRVLPGRPEVQTESPPAAEVPPAGAESPPEMSAALSSVSAEAPEASGDSDQESVQPGVPDHDANPADELAANA